MKYYKFILLLPWLFSLSLCEVSEEKKSKLLSDFISYYNLKPYQNNVASEGILRSIREIDATTYKIEVSFKVQENVNAKVWICVGTVQDLDEQGIAIVNNDLSCAPTEQLPAEEGESLESVEVQQERRPVKLENEVQADTAITSGEQFIAIPRDQPSAPCIGCASHVNPQAPGVTELANMGVRHLDLHEPTVKHSLESVKDVERQVQVVNGVRYILALSINFNNCTEVETDSCVFTKTCKVSILVKPWQTLPSGAKYRAILANNCTEEWQFGDNGEILPESTENHDNKGNIGYASADDDLKVERHEYSQSQPNQEKTLTIDEIRTIEDQILPNEHAQSYSNQNQGVDKSSSDGIAMSKDHVVKDESVQRYNDNYVTVTESVKHETSGLDPDKKKAIDEMLDFLKFSNFEPRTQSEGQSEGTFPRVKRSYDYDLQVLSLTENFRDLKKSIENAKYIYEMAQVMVDYLNEMDMVVKNRAIKNVIKAEEEEDNDKRFVYVQAQVVIPCETANCAPKEAQTKICNGVLDSTNKNNPQILSTFCYIDTKEMDSLDNIKEVPLDDPVLLRLTKEIIRKIESESSDPHAIKIQKIVTANTHVVSGRLTKVTLIVDRTSCNKSVPLVLRTNCSTLQYFGSNICEVVVHEKHWLKEKKISYTCTERPIDMTISEFKQNNMNITIDDPKINEILQEALQYLEIQSEKTNKQKIVNVNKISTIIIAGFLTNIEFVVGYTNCTDANDLKSPSGKCALLKNERLRRCKAQIWDRSWIVDGRQMEVTCDEDAIISKTPENMRKKRSLDFDGRQAHEMSEQISRTNRRFGGTQNQDVTDPRYKKLAEESLQKYVQDSGNSQSLHVTRIERVITQVVSGLLTRIDFMVSSGRGSNEFKCYSKVWEQSWLNKKDIDVSCENDNKLVKRDLMGGATNQNPNDPKYLQLADESLHKYLENTGNTAPHQVVRVEHVTTQVVSGIKTKISFVVSPIDSSKGDTLNCMSEVWEQSWLNKKDIVVSCENDNERVKRDLPGGASNQNPNDPKYLQLANESLHKYLENTGNTAPHRVVRVKHVTTQVVSGIKTKISFVVSPIDSSKGDTLNCMSEVWEQSWLNKKDIVVSCENDNERVKRDLPGGASNQNPNDPKYLQLANESLHKYLKNIGNTAPHRVVRVKHVTTQVVSGIKTKISFVVSPIDSSKGDTLNCMSEVWEQSWLNKKDIVVSCENDNERVKRDLPGGASNQNPNDPKYLQLANESLHKYLENTGNTAPHRVVRVKHVTTQVVSGIKTKISFVVSSIDSSKGDTLNCMSEVWEQSWLNKKDIVVSCENDNERVKRDLPGGASNQNPNDPKYLQLANESLHKYLENTGNTAPHRVVRVKHVTTQVVSGIKTKISFVVSPIDSSKGDTLNCMSEVWEQSWLNKKDIVVSCENDNERVKRDLPGGASNQNPNDPKYLQLANESLHKYLENIGNTAPHRVVRVKHVTTQVVSGIKTKISFVVSSIDSSKGDTLNCISEVWEQSWLNKKDIDVSCENDNERVKRDLPGGASNQNPNDPKYLQLANESLHKYLENTGNTAPHRVVRVKHVTTQVVSGIKTKISFVVSSIDSSKGDTLNCISEVWEQSWLNKKDIDVSCENDNERVKRDLPGGASNQNPNDPKYLQLANESLHKYLENTGNTAPHRVVRVKHVTTQVVSGIKTKISFVVSPIDSSKGDTLNCMSEVWEQSWLNKKDIVVSCENDNERVKRDLPGGASNQNPNDPKYLQLANESLHKYLENTGNTAPHRVVRVKHVTTQVVSGIKTKISFVVSPIDSSKGDTLNCISEVWEQSWLNKKDIDVSCENDNERVKRDLPGGASNQNPNDPKYLQLANESLHKYLENTGNTAPHRVVRVKHVTTQVVSGIKTKISFVVSPIDSSKGDTLNCMSEVWEQSWLNKKDIVVSCENDNERVKRDLPGGASNQNPNDPKYLQLANESLHKYLENTGNTAPHRVVRVKHVTTQVVSGIKTKISFVVSPIDSSKGDTLNCMSEVWEQSWLNKKDIVVSCENDDERVKRDLPGGVSNQNPNDPKYLQLANESLHKYLENTGNTAPHRVVRVKHVTTQVVSGIKTKIIFVVSPIDSSKGDTLNCMSEVWEQSWLNKKDIVVSCENDNERVKRDLMGGASNQNPNDPKYLQLANESLHKYLENTGNTAPHRVVRVKHVTTQVVSGIKTKISFVVSPIDSSKGDTLNCISEVWEQSWLNKKDIDVSCENNNERVKRDLMGGASNQNPNDPKYLQLANESLHKYLENTGNTAPHRVVRVKHVTTQVVSGIKTKISFVVSPIDSSKGDTLNCMSEVWEQSWLNKKDIVVSCENDNERVKRDLPGGVSNQNPNDPKYLQLANESLHKYLQKTGITVLHRVVRVEHVTTQVVSGIRTKITFVVSPIDSSKGDTLNCISEVWEQSWLNKKDIDVSCEKDNKGVIRQIPGGLSDQNPNDPKYLQLANESLHKYLQKTGITVLHRVVRVEHVTTQVVSGIKTKITFVVSPIDSSKGDTLNCISEVWEQSWLNKKDIDVSCEKDNKGVIRQIPGGLSDQNPNDPKYLQLANESLHKYLENIGNTAPHRVVRVKHVTTQVVSGIKTKISFVVSPIDSSKGDTLNCMSEVWEQSWLNKKDIDVSCEKDNKEVTRPGGLSDRNPNDPKYLELANESLRKYLSESGNRQPHKVIRVEKVSTQIVSGLLTRLNFVVLSADTSKSIIMNCYSEVLEQPWLDIKDIKVSCQIDDQRLKRRILGGIKEENPNDAKYLQLADESLQKYLLDTGNQHPYKVVRIEQVTIQVVAGLLIRINFVVTRADNHMVNGIMNCFSEILEQAWMNKKEVNVMCESDPINSRPKRELMQENNINKHSFENKNVEVEDDATKPEYQLLSAQALRKYSKRVGRLHKIVEVQHVTKRVVAGITYKIDFTASPTECLANVSNVRALSCKVMASTTIYCSAHIWDQPWIRKKKINIGCSMEEGADYVDYSDEETETKAPSADEILTSAVESSRAKQQPSVNLLAEEALEFYLSSSNRKYVYRITEIYSFSEHIADGIISKIEFSISPTVCLRYGYIDSIDNCEFKNPRVEYHCNAKILDRSWLGVDKDIKITCKKIENKSKVGKRSKRQTDTKHIEDEDNVIDEDTSYYYADRAVQSVNDGIDTNNLYKLISIHAVLASEQMKTMVVKMYIEIAETYCLRQRQGTDVNNCEEMEGLNHRLCFARIFPSPDDELVIKHVIVVCDDDDDEFNYITGIHIPELLRLSIEDLERNSENHYKLIHQGEPQVIPSLETSKPIRLNFIVATTNCTKNVDLSKNPFQCFIENSIPPKACHSFIWLEAQSRTIHLIDSKCDPALKRFKRSDSSNTTADDSEIDKLVTAALDKLEMASIHTYKQRVLHINSYSSKITSGKVTTIDFDVGYTACLKYEWIKNVTSCDFLEHMPRRHCVAQIWERLWINNGMNIDVSCEDDETPLEAHIEFESAEMAMQLAQEALKHIEAKYPHPKKQKVVRIFSLEKQVVAGIHYRMKVEVGFTNCVALSDQTDCKFEKNGLMNKFCRVNVWVRPWTDHPPNFRVSCDYQGGASTDLFYHVQAEQLFYNFIATYNPIYVNDHIELEKRFEIFKENIKKIHEMNIHEKGTATYGVNRFADLTYNEFRSRYMGLKTGMRDANQPPMKQATIPNIKIPVSFDWRTSDAVTEVKDQGSCGSCWAFSTIGNIESHWKIKNGELISLSEQELLDCDKIDDGCNGGLPENAYRSIQQLGGVEVESNYPYEGGSDKCLFNKSMSTVSISGSVNITSNETGMAQWLVFNGPISVGIDARAMQFYLGGIAHPWKSYCKGEELDHSALIVGYGVKDLVAYHRKLPFWIIKNSWGKAWGDQGYYFLHRGDGTCGVNKLVNSAIIDYM